MRRGFKVRPKADGDIDAIAEFLAEGGGLDTALRFLADLEEALSLLAAQSGMGWKCKSKSSAFSTAPEIWTQ